MSADAANPRVYQDMKGSRASNGNVNGHIVRLAEAKPGRQRVQVGHLPVRRRGRSRQGHDQPVHLGDNNDLSSPDGLVFSPATGICWIQTDDGAYTDKTTAC